MGSKRLVYVIGNDLFPGLYKIGYTTDLKKRLNSFNSNSGVCSSYDCYIVWYVDEEYYDKKIHRIIDEINPGLRVVQDKFGRSSETEFYNCSLEFIWFLFYAMALGQCNLDRLYHVMRKGNDLYIYNDMIKPRLLFDEIGVEYDNHTNNGICDEFNESLQVSSVTPSIINWWSEEGSKVEYAWDRIPWVLLYGSYKWWVNKNFINVDVGYGIKKFAKEFKNKILPQITDVWVIPDSVAFSVGRHWDIAEPLIGKYNIDELKNPNYNGGDWSKLGSNAGQYKRVYKGLVKVSNNSVNVCEV